MASKEEDSIQYGRSRDKWKPEPRKTYYPSSPSQPIQDTTNTEWVDELFGDFLIAKELAVKTVIDYNPKLSNKEVADLANPLIDRLKLEAKATILKHVKEAQVKARIDEVDRIQSYVNNRERFTNRLDSEIAYLEMRRMELASLAELKSQLTPTQSEEKQS